MTKRVACPFCEASHPENTKFCPNTGKSLTEPPKKEGFALLAEKGNYFLRHTLWELPIWQFIGIIVGVVAIWATYDVFHKTQEIKDIQIVTLADTSLVEIKDDVYSDIAISYKGKNINNLSLLQLKVENIGTQPVLSTDYIQPISFIFPRQAQIIESTIVESEPRNINAQLTLENNSVYIEPLLLNPGDRFVIRLVVANIPPLCSFVRPNAWDNIPRTPYAALTTPTPEHTPPTPSPSHAQAFVCAEKRFSIQARITGISYISTVNTIYERKSITQDITVRFVVLYSLTLLFLVSIKLMREQIEFLGSIWSSIKMVISGLLIRPLA